MPEDESDATGLEGRYHVEKVNDPTGKHAECRYFVLDPQHDPLARYALAEYASRARAAGYDTLADDLHEWLTALARRRSCPTPCDPECTSTCHEVHNVAWSRHHQPHNCPAQSTSPIGQDGGDHS